ncbi:MAG: SAM-dependent methyltransferase [Saprospiraceae bacterium]
MLDPSTHDYTYSSPQSKKNQKVLFKSIKSNVEVIDSEFDLIYPKEIYQTSEIHFTPIEIAKVAARYLADSRDTKILDVGSGAGKFCMIGSVCTEGRFFGVELRKSLCTTAQRISKYYNLENVAFINSNITNIEFSEFDAFYFYNSFFENVYQAGRIDDKVELRRELYDEYSLYVKEQLDKTAIGTKLVTYFSSSEEVPESFELQFSDFDGKLKMWKKIS